MAVRQVRVQQARRKTVYSPERRAAFRNWAQTQASDAAVICRLLHHDVPHLLEPTAGVEKQRDGSYIQQDECRRECGTLVTKWISSDGIVTKTSSVPKARGETTATPVDYEYDPNKHYLMPPEARMRMGREEYAFLRQVALQRRVERQEEQAKVKRKRGPRQEVPKTAEPLFQAPALPVAESTTAGGDTPA